MPPRSLRRRAKRSPASTAGGAAGSATGTRPGFSAIWPRPRIPPDGRRRVRSHDAVQGTDESALAVAPESVAEEQDVFPGRAGKAVTRNALQERLQVLVLVADAVQKRQPRRTIAAGCNGGLHDGGYACGCSRDHGDALLAGDAHGTDGSPACQVRRVSRRPEHRPCRHVCSRPHRFRMRRSIA